MSITIALAGNPNSGKTTLFKRPHRLQPVCGQLAPASPWSARRPILT